MNKMAGRIVEVRLPFSAEPGFICSAFDRSLKKLTVFQIFLVDTGEASHSPYIE